MSRVQNFDFVHTIFSTQVNVWKRWLMMTIHPCLLSSSLQMENIFWLLHSTTLSSCGTTARWIIFEKSAWPTFLNFLCYRVNVWRRTPVTRMKSIACLPTFPWRVVNGSCRAARTTWSTSGTCRPRRLSRSWPATLTWCSPPHVIRPRTSLHPPVWRVTKQLNCGDQTRRFRELLCLGGIVKEHQLSSQRCIYKCTINRRVIVMFRFRSSLFCWKKILDFGLKINHPFCSRNVGKE